MTREHLFGNEVWELTDVMDHYTFADGTPFGIATEEGPSND